MVTRNLITFTAFVCEYRKAAPVTEWLRALIFHQPASLRCVWCGFELVRQAKFCLRVVQVVFLEVITY